jgi:16S rRNA (adenine1518-N6/adenine1519-N6)-dimethyltransferase
MKKNLDKGQHFLIDKDVLKKEIEISEISKEDKIIEIGAGEGILTKEISKKPKKVLSFEIDKQYENQLNKLENKFKNLKIIYSDATKYPWKDFNKIISNIPYYLGEKIITKSIKEDISILVLIVGENFKKILEKNSSKSGILTNLFYEFKPIQKIKKNSFSPSPRTNSWLIKLKLKKQTNILKFIKYILKRRGKIKNAMIYGLINQGYTKNQSREILKKLNLNKMVLEKQTSKITGKFILKIYKDIEIFL